MLSRSLVVVVASLFTLAGCGGDTDTLPKAFLSLLDETTAVLKEVKDVETAKAAEPKLKALGERKRKLDEEAKNTKLSQSDLKAADDKYAQPMQEAAERMAAEIMRIASESPEAAQIVAAAAGMQ